MKKVAKLLKSKKHLGTLGGTTWQKTYRLTPPLEGNKIVCISATTVFSMPETYIFPSKKDGYITNFTELNGSQKGTLSHAKILRDLGYKIEN